MDERHLKYLYAALAVLFGLPSLFFGGAGACIALVMGVIGLVSLDADKLWFAAGMFAWGSCAITGLVAWVALSIFWLRDGARGLRMASRRWWWLLGMGVLAGLPMLAMALYYFTELGPSVLSGLFAGPSLLVPAGMLMLLWLRVEAVDPPSAPARASE
ncbi:hypothetical protein CCR98_03180 [Stenotrophomonas sp. WZN-1]|uniref:hypothetical protein n=1 Tax=unclassified Stenotrophomonas TaxID=196198 RepID=UPI000B445F7D|nr:MULTISPECIES: hypothetical protein [unclassified Stenotrophomonas]ARZ73227.1 hypothetical protein CCR98_03180 [Stenotrophomonas sp. WZN-1]